MSTFIPSTWTSAGDRITTAADTLYRTADPITMAVPITSRGSSPVDVAVCAGDALCNGPWHNLVAMANEGMTSLGSKLTATGEDYAATEEGNRAAAERFWKGI